MRISSAGDTLSVLRTQGPQQRDFLITYPPPWRDQGQDHSDTHLRAEIGRNEVLRGAKARRVPLHALRNGGIESKDASAQVRDRVFVLMNESRRTRRSNARGNPRAERRGACPANAVTRWSTGWPRCWAAYSRAELFKERRVNFEGPLRFQT